MEVASRTPPLVAGLARAAAAGGSGIARTSLEMLSKLCLYNSQGYCLALQVHMEGLGSRSRCKSKHSWGTHCAEPHACLSAGGARGGPALLPAAPC